MHIDKNMCGTFSLPASYPRVMIGPSVIFMFYYTDEIVLHVPEDEVHFKTRFKQFDFDCDRK